MNNNDIQSALTEAFVTLDLALIEVASQVVNGRGPVWDESEHEVVHDEIVAATTKFQVKILKYLVKVNETDPAFEED